MNTLKNINFFLQILKAKIQKKYIPFSVQFSITSRCNSHCNYCYAKYYQRELPELDTQTIKRIIRQLAEIGTKRLSLVGGEPLVKKDIEKIIDYVKAKDIECAITSNGYLVPSFLKTIKKIDILSISLDGREKSHDAGREKGSWKKAMKAIRLAHNHKIPLQISAVLTKKNLNDLQWLANLGRKYKTLISFTPLINQTEGNKKLPIYRLLPNNKQYHWAFNKIINMKKRGAPFLYHQKVYQIARDWPDYTQDKIINKKPSFNYIPCQAGHYTAIIDSNGDMYPCPQLIDVIKVKNAAKDGVKKAWQFINNHSCKACCSPCYNNLSLIFSLDFEVLYDLWRSYKRTYK